MGRSVGQGLAALLVSSGGDLLAGLTLGAITHTLEALPGLLVLIPAAIGMRGNIFGALGSRLGTAIHTGTFSLSRRADTVVGENVLASLSLTFSVSLALAVLAKAIAVGFGVSHTISIADFVVISVVGGVVSSVVVLALTLGVAAGSVRFGWDMDNVAAPLVTAAGDVVTLPSLFPATVLVRLTLVTRSSAASSPFWRRCRSSPPSAPGFRCWPASSANRCRCSSSPEPSMWWPASPSRSVWSRFSSSRLCWC